ncbi:2-phosphosulfolactate phosphatase [Diaminobutyricimonas sp. LJ205]|uniref:2-phosphosulfolactate phosphatase n=1 Tax=Diaminobutyricimonas sp. LJ205 TaxID=2683590 RepID=UPI0012F4A3EA|nr:2-phosphosulfolactate phosphatase [Diaminobutyricimonas sp. LJ205]
MSESQATYQVRFDWGLAGAAATQEGADAVIWVDQLAADDGTGDATGDQAGEAAGAAGLSEPEGALVLATVQNARAVADWVLERQHERGGRFRVTVIAAGGVRADGSPRFSVEDLLAAGAVIDALTELGLDHCSPEAAAAGAAYAGLKNATKHLVKNSVTGRELGVSTLDLTPRDEVTVVKEPAAA